MDNIIKKFLISAEEGTIFVGEKPYFICFYNTLLTKKEKLEHKDSDIPVLIINEKSFFESIKKYLNETLYLEMLVKEDVEKLVMQKLISLFCNATYDDFVNIEAYIARVIEFNRNKLIEDEITINNIEALDNSDIVIKLEKQLFSLETPYVMTFKIQKEINGIINEYNLPNISFGISNNKCYIYTVQQPHKTNNENTYTKKINRLLYKVNQGVVNDNYDDILDIDKVSPSAIVSLTLLFTLLKNDNITNIEVIPFLPIRYQNKIESFNARINYELSSNPNKYKTKEQKEALKTEYEQERLRIQNNLTQKFIMDFFRLQFHFNSIIIKTIPHEYNDNMNVSINDNLYTNNKFLSEIIDKTRQVLQNKVK